jgi:light-independent protochlorophyllide reductase B subunit
MKTAVQIPRGTCRLFGAIKALGTLQRTVVLVHGPKGCVYHINYILGMRGDRPSNIYSTCLEEKDVIFGAQERLVEAIEEIDQQKRPDLIAVLSCCASSIIGEDVASAVQEAGTRARVIGIESGGFEGDFREGYSETLKQLAEELVEKPAHQRPRSVNLVGVLRSGPDLKELRRILAVIGVEVNAVLTAGATLKEIERMGEAALNLVLCEPSGKASAESLQQRFGTPFLSLDLPIGPEATFRFLREVAGALEVPMERIPVPWHPLEAHSLERRIAIVSGPTRAIAFARFLKNLNLVPVLIILDFDSGTRERLQLVVGEECEILIEPDPTLIIEKMKEKEVDLVLGGMLERPIASQLGIEFLDVMHGSQKTLGVEGGRYLLEILQGPSRKTILEEKD